MKAGLYVIEQKPTVHHDDGSVSRNLPPKRTVVHAYGDGSMAWMGGDSLSSEEEVLRNWTLVATVDIDELEVRKTT